MNIIRNIRWWVSHLLYVNSRLGNMSLNIAAISIVGIILSIDANVIAAAANGGKMPVVVETGYAYVITERHVLANDTTSLKFLGDWIAIDQGTVLPEHLTPFIESAGKLLNFPVGENAVASPGDVGMWVFLITGILAILLSFMCALWHYAKRIRVT